MVKNTYFSNFYRPTSDMLEDLYINQIDAMGNTAYYLPKNRLSYNNIFQEVIDCKYDSAYEICVYIDKPDGFSGNGDMFGFGGIMIKDQATFKLSRRRFEEIIGVGTGQVRPYEGDIIYLPVSQSFFEIRFVEHQNPFYQFNQSIVYDLKCELYTYNNEDFDTGIEEIDILENQRSQVIIIKYSDVTDEDWIIGEQLEFENGMTVELLAANAVTKEIKVSHLVSPSDGLVLDDTLEDSTLIGSISNTEFTIETIYTLNNVTDETVPKVMPNDYSDNTVNSTDLDDLFVVENKNILGNPY